MGKARLALGAVLVIALGGGTVRSARAGEVSGVVYDARTSAPLAGVRLRVFYDGEDAEAPNREVPASRLGSGQQGQQTAASGAYRFDLEGGRRYRLAVDTDGTGLGFPSVAAAPAEGFARLGAVVASDAPPPPDGAHLYYLRFALVRATDAVRHNHVPLDRLRDAITLTASADRPSLAVGDVAAIAAEVDNQSAHDLTDGAGEPVFVRAELPRGLALVPGSAAARIRRGEAVVVRDRAIELRDDARSDRALRFGPFDLAAGATLTLGFQVTGGADGAAGDDVIRLVLVDGRGRDRSSGARVVLTRTDDRALDQTAVVGRVFCDRDGDGEIDADEAGVLGAKIYADSGSVAVTDTDGLFHFGALSPGDHVIKLDRASLAGGRELGAAVRRLDVGSGVLSIARFPVRCVAVTVGMKHYRAHLRGAGVTPPPPHDLRIHGVIGDGTVAGFGLRYTLPSATLRLVVPATAQVADRNLVAPGAAGYADPPRFELGARVAGGASRWHFVIDEVASDGSHTPFFTGHGADAPPAELAWDGRGGDGSPARPGTLYAAQLSVSGAERASEAQSAWLPFAIELGGTSERRETWTGPLFAGSAKQPRGSAALTAKLAALARTLGPGDDLTLEVHGDGTGDRVAAVARTQREAELAAKLLVAAGVDASRVHARGRGALAPVDRSGTAAARAANRRVVVVISHPAAPGSVPATLGGVADVLVDGAPIAADPDGTFDAWLPARPSLVVDVAGADGARAALEIGEPAAAPDDLPPARTLVVHGDLAAHTVQLGDEQPPVALLAVDATLAAPARTLVRKGRRTLVAPLHFTLASPAGLAVASWSLTIADEGAELWRQAGSGAPPATLDWDGLVAGDLVLERGHAYAYRLTLVTVDGNQAISPVGELLVDGQAPTGLTGTLFDATGKPGTRLKNALSAIASRVGKGGPAIDLDLTIALAGQSEAEHALVIAARQAQVKAYLGKLGVTDDRYRLTVRGDAARHGDALSERSGGGAAAARVLINGHAITLRGDRFVTDATAPAGGAIVVDVSLADGHRSVVVVRAPEEPSWVRRQAHRAAPAPVTPKAGLDLAGFRVELPPDDAVLAARELPVRGVAPAGVRVTINGEAVPLGADGRFATIVELPAGKSRLAILAHDGAGHDAVLNWPVEVADHEGFLLAFGEAGMATAYADGWAADASPWPAANPHTTTSLGGFDVFGRAVVFGHARAHDLAGFDDVSATIFVDSARRRLDQPLFAELADPTRDFPVFGDAASEVRVADSRGPIYARIDADRWHALVGSVRGELHGGHLFGYERGGDGAEFRVDQAYDDGRVEASGFATRAGAAEAHSVDWYRATGGALYYLRHDRVIEGSEDVEVVVRDRDSGLVVSQTPLGRDVDYRLDYDGGRILLTTPLPSTAGSAWLIGQLEASTTPLDGNPVYLEVGYQHAAAATGDRAGGAYLRDRTGPVTLGGGVVDEARADGDYSLWGADATVQAGAHSTITAELASSRALDAGNQLSQDGGLSFQDFDRAGADAIATAPGARQYAWRAAADLDLGDVAAALDGTHVNLYGQALDRGYSAADTLPEQGRLKLGGRITQSLGDAGQLILRHDAQRAELPRVGPTAADLPTDANAPLDRRSSYLTSLAWLRDAGPWHYRIEAAHQQLTATEVLASGGPAIDADRVGVAAGSAYDVSRRLTVRMSQAALVATGDADPTLRPLAADGRREEPSAGIATTVGGDLALAADVRLSADYVQRWNGDNAAQFGLRSALSELGSMYVAERVGQADGRAAAATVVGATDRFGPDHAGRTFGEYQLEHGVSGSRNRAVLGLGHSLRPVRGFRIGYGFEHQQTFGGYLPDGTAVGQNTRDVVNAALDLTRFAWLKAGGRIELRLDQGLRGGARDLVDDARPGQPPGGFADHGGTLPGAPLILPAGERTQVVGSLGADARLGDATLFGRFAATKTVAGDEQLSIDRFTLARERELTLGAAVRPLGGDAAALVRYSYLLDRRPAAVAVAPEATSHVLAVLGTVEWPRRLVWAGKLAWKSTSETSASPGDVAVTPAASHAVLGLARLAYRFAGRFDLAGEVRQLALWKPVGREDRTGVLAEVGFELVQYLRLAGGYDFSRFSDDELGDLERDGHGVFARVTGMY